MYLDYAGIRVTRLAPAIRFLERGLGLVVRSRGTMEHGGKWVLLQDPRSQQRLEVNYYPPGSRYWTPFVAGEGLDHVGVRVGNLAAAGRKLRAAGARKVSEIREDGRAVIVYYEGPDHLWVELIHAPTE